MSSRHSFVQSKEGKILSLAPLLDSHSVICSYYGLKEDEVNKYEYNPDKRTILYGIKGLSGEKEIFEPSLSDTTVIESYIKNNFPTKDSFDSYDNFKNAITKQEIVDKLVEVGITANDSSDTLEFFITGRHNIELCFDFISGVISDDVFNHGLDCSGFESRLK